MPLDILQLTIFALGLITLASGIWLFVHARDVAREFRREPDIAVGPGVRVTSRESVVFALIVFNLGWVAALAFWALVI